MDSGKLIGAAFEVALIVLACALVLRWFNRARSRRQGAIRGAVAGGLAGIAFSGLFGLAFALLHPDDPSAGSEAIIGIGTFPIGLLIGLVIGLWRRPPRGKC